MTSGTGFDIGPAWRRLAAAVAIAWVVWGAALTAAIGAIEPFILVFAIVPVIAWGATRWRPGRISYTVFGVLGLLTILLNLPFVVASLAHPESAVGFNLDLFAVLVALLQTALGVRVWAGFGDRVAGIAWKAAAGVFAIGLAISIVAFMGLEDDEAQAGDIAVLAEKLEFAPLAITAPAGTIAVFVENADRGRHTFTITGLVDAELPASTGRRVVFDASPGTYEIFCAVPGHESMTATLTVTG